MDKRFIQDEAERILKLLEGATLFGERVDMTNAEQVIVAAYHAGQTAQWMSQWSWRELEGQLGQAVGT